MQDLHLHTTYDDGGNSVREMAEKGLRSGFSSIGLCVHSPIPGESWCATEAGVRSFISDVHDAAEMLRGRMPVYCGIEFDSVSTCDLSMFDYVIGSVHVLQAPGGPWYYDASREETLRMIETVYGGDRNQAAEDYYARVGSLAEVGAVDIVGHFDLLTKFDEPECVYDVHSSRYRDAAHFAMERLVNAGKIFEINTGAVSRGYRTTFYPSDSLLKELFALGGKVCLSSDSHSVDTLGFQREKALACALAAGFDAVWEWNGTDFAPEKI